MDNISLWLALMIPIVATPGPANIACMISGAKRGVKRSWPFILGMEGSLTIYSLMAGLGVATLVSAHPTLEMALKCGGILYILYLSYQLYNAGFGAADSQENAEKTFSFSSGFMIQLFNPKAIAALAMMYAEFTSGAQQLENVIILAVSLAVLNIVVHLIWASGGGLLREYFASIQKGFGRLIMPVMMLVVAIWLLTDFYKNYV